jgi:hypothetical protein
MSVKRQCARCRKPYWTRSYCAKCEERVAKAYRKRKKSEGGALEKGRISPPIPLGEVGGAPPRPDLDAQKPPQEACEGFEASFIQATRPGVDDGGA